MASFWASTWRIRQWSASCNTRSQCAQLPARRLTFSRRRLPEDAQARYFRSARGHRRRFAASRSSDAAVASPRRACPDALHLRRLRPRAPCSPTPCQQSKHVDHRAPGAASPVRMSSGGRGSASTHNYDQHTFLLHYLKDAKYDPAIRLRIRPFQSHARAWGQGAALRALTRAKRFSASTAGSNSTSGSTMRWSTRSAFASCVLQESLRPSSKPY